jgi:hypothetical protein
VTANTGFDVGCCEPPDGSTVTATCEALTAAAGRLTTAGAERAVKVPAGLGVGEELNVQAS